MNKLLKNIFFPLLVIFCFFSTVVGQDLSVVNQANPQGLAQQNKPYIYACSGLNSNINEFEYKVENLLPTTNTGTNALVLNSVQFNLPDGYDYVAGTLTFGGNPGDVTYSGGVLIGAIPGGIQVSENQSLIIYFQAKVDCRVNSVASDVKNVIPFTLSYLKNGIPYSYQVVDSKSNTNTFDILNPVLKPSYTAVSPATAALIPTVEYTRDLIVTNSGTAPSKNFKIAYTTPNPYYNNIVQMSLPVLSGAIITQISSDPLVYSVDLGTNSLNPGQSVTIHENFKIIDCRGTYLQYKTEIDYACAVSGSCSDEIYKQNTTPAYNIEGGNPSISISSNDIAFTDAQQTIVYDIQNNASASLGVARDINFTVSGSAIISSAELINSNGLSAGTISVTNNQLDFSSLSTSPNYPFTNLDADGSGLKNDLAGGVHFSLKLNFYFDCSSNASLNKDLVLRADFKNICNSPTYVSQESSLKPDANVFFLIEGNTDFEYGVPGAIKLKGTKPTIAAQHFSYDNLYMYGTVSIPDVLDMNINAYNVTGPVVAGGKKTYTFQFKNDGAADCSGGNCNYNMIASSFEIDAVITNNNACLTYSEEEIEFSIAFKSSVSTCAIGTQPLVDQVYLIGADDVCLTNGGTPVTGNGSGTGIGTPGTTVDPSEGKLKTQLLTVERITWGYKPSAFYLGTDLTNANRILTDADAALINKGAAIENDDIRFIATGTIKGGTISSAIKLRVKYNFDGLSQDLPLDFTTAQVTFVQKSSGGTVKRTVNITGTDIYIRREGGSNNRLIDINIPGGTLFAEDDIFTCTFVLKVKTDFASNTGQYLSKSLRANYYVVDPAATISRGTRLGLYQYVKNVNGSYDQFVQQYCGGSYVATDAYTNQNNINPFNNEFRPLIKINKILQNQQFKDYLASTGGAAYNLHIYNTDNNASIAINNPDNINVYLPWSNYYISLQSGLFATPACNTAAYTSPHSTSFDYEYVPNTSIKGITSGYNYYYMYTPYVGWDNSTSVIYYSSYTSQATWDLYFSSSSISDVDFYLKVIPKGTNKATFVSYSMNSGAAQSQLFVPNTYVKLTGTNVNSYNKITLAAVFSNCTAAYVDKYDVQIISVCKGKPVGCTSEAPQTISLQLEYRSSILGLSMVKDRVILANICKGYALSSTIQSLGVADLTNVSFALGLPNGFTFDKPNSMVTFNAADYSFTDSDPSTVTNLVRSLPNTLNTNISFMGWKMSGIINGNGTLQGSRTGQFGQNLDVLFKLISKCSSGMPDDQYAYDPEDPIQVIVQGTKNCGSPAAITSTIQVIPYDNYVSPEGSINLKLRAASFTSCDKKASVLLDATNLSYGSTTGGDEYMVELAYDPAKVKFNTMLVGDAPFSTSGGYVRWFMNAAAKQYILEFELLEGVASTETSTVYSAKIRKSIQVDLCQDAPGSCSKVYAMVGYNPTRTAGISLPDCDLSGITIICALASGNVYDYATTPRPGATYTWTLPDPAYAELVGTSNTNQISIKYKNLTSAPATIGSIKVSISEPGSSTPIVFERTVYVKQPVENESPLSIELPCPGLPVAANTVYKVKINGASTSSFYQLDMNQDGVPDFTASEDYVNVSFPSPGVYTVRLLGDASDLCSTGDGTLTVTVVSYEAYLTAQAICAVKNQTSTIRLDGPASASNSNFIWYKDGQPLNNASGNTYEANAPGVYAIALKDLSCATDDVINTVMASSANDNPVPQSLAAAALNEVSAGSNTADASQSIADNNIIQNALAAANAASAALAPPPSQLTVAPSAASVPTLLFMLGNYEVIQLDGVVYIRTVIRAEICFQDKNGSGGGCTGNNCPDCVLQCSSCFKPESGKAYILTAWVHEDVEQSSSLVNQGKVEVEFAGGTTAKYVAQMKAEDPLIDGWKRVFVRFVTPANYATMTIRLQTSPDFDVYYDDIRLHPEDGTMQSFVYDPVYLRLSSTLDENNYATFYEYDNEGKLVRVKKETARGIMTIKETRENTSIK